MKKRGLWVALFFLALLGYLIWSSLGQRRFRVEVCMDFNSRSSCRTASSATQENALRTATENACAIIAPGRTESRQCETTPPAKVTWLEGR